MRIQLLSVLAFGLFLSSNLFAAGTEPFRDSALTAKARVDDLLTRLTLQEKVDLCHGNFTSGGVPRLGIGPLLMLDGRQGLRPVDDQKGAKTTSLPCGLALSCTWDDEAARRFGGVLAEEMLALKRHVLLAPMLNMVRSPLGGRNFENFGEDPYLVGRIGSAYINGVQDLGVGACSCLLVANDCEFRRHFTSSNMDERTLREYHMRSYAMSVQDGNVWSMMTGNNILNGTYCAQNKHLVQELMKDTVGFDGVMITDWRGAYDTLPTALAGTDMTTGFCSYVFGDGNLLKAVKSGDVPMELLDEKVRRILLLYVRSGVLDPDKRLPGSLDTPEHRKAARELAANGMVLLKNEQDILPLQLTTTSKILVTGPAADRVLQGGGSGHVPAAIEITPLQGLKEVIKADAEISHLPYPLNLQKVIKNKRKLKSPTSATLQSAASKADVVVFVAAGYLASEGRDLLTMDLPGNQAADIAAMAEVNPNVIVVLQANGAVSLNGWGDRAAAILAIHYSGEATGMALADVLTGAVNPSGKLSYTFARKLDDYACHALNEWPAKLRLDKDPVDAGFKPHERKATHAFDTSYDEGVFSGYRWLDDKNIEPAYPFGFGLSYTTFTLSAPLLTAEGDGKWQVTCRVTNTGDRAGAEVVQLYVAPPKSKVRRPARELKGYCRVMLQPGESGEATFTLSKRDLAYFDDTVMEWAADAGEYKIQLGTSSRDLPIKTMVELKERAKVEMWK